MKIRAGAAFHHRNPATAPIIAAATMAASSAAFASTRSTPSARHRAAHVWRNCQNAMNTKAASTRIDEPAARPSSPSVRFTAFDDAVSDHERPDVEQDPEVRSRCRG